MCYVSKLFGYFSRYETVVGPVNIIRKPNDYNVGYTPRRKFASFVRNVIGLLLFFPRKTLPQPPVNRRTSETIDFYPVRQTNALENHRTRNMWCEVHHVFFGRTALYANVIYACKMGTKSEKVISVLRTGLYGRRKRFRLCTVYDTRRHYNMLCIHYVYIYYMCVCHIHV